MERPLNPESLSHLLGQAIAWRAKRAHLAISPLDISPRGEAVCLSPQFRHLSYKFTKLGDFWTMPAVREPFPWHFPHNLIWKEKIKLSPTQNCQPNALKEFDRKKQKTNKTLQTLRWRDHLHLCVKASSQAHLQARKGRWVGPTTETSPRNTDERENSIHVLIDDQHLGNDNFRNKARLHLNGEWLVWVKMLAF